MVKRKSLEKVLPNNPDQSKTMVGVHLSVPLQFSVTVLSLSFLLQRLLGVSDDTHFFCHSGTQY
jgi:hypothetical protein